MALDADHDMIDRLARIETKLDVYLKQATDHEGRIRILEQAKWRLFGFASALGLLGGGAATKLLGG